MPDFLSMPAMRCIAGFFCPRFGGVALLEARRVRAGSARSGRFVSVLFDRRLEPVRLDNQQVAGEVLQGSFGRCANKQALPAIARYGPHYHGRSLEFLGHHRQFLVGQAGYEV